MTLELIYKINLMSSKIKVLQVIPRLGYGGAETGCFDLAHYLSENNCSSFIVTSGGELIKYINKKKVKLIRLPVHSKNPILMLLNSLILIGIILFFNILKACAVCYGAPDDPVTLGMNKGIMFLLLVVMFVLSCIMLGIISLVNRTNKIKIEELK